MDLPTVGDSADQGMGLDGFCYACKKSRYWTPAEAVKLFGHAVPIKHAQRRLKCACGATGTSRPCVELRTDIGDFYARLRENGHGVGQGGSTRAVRP